MLADELAHRVTALGRPVIRASVDGFHNPRDHRYRRGRDSPEGYFHDSCDHAGLKAAPRSVPILDGIFLHRPELRAYWDLSIFLDVSFAVCQSRQIARDPSCAGSPLAQSRYVPGQRLHLASCDPARRATVVVNYNDLAAPRLA